MVKFYSSLTTGFEFEFVFEITIVLKEIDKELYNLFMVLSDSMN